MLQMIAKNPEERLLYELSLKRERDVESMVAQGREEGREEGVLIGQVQLLQKLLRETPHGANDLLKLGMVRLVAMEQELQQRLRNRS